MENRPPVETGVWRRKRVETRSMMVRDLTRFSWFCVVAMRFNARLYGCRLKPASDVIFRAIMVQVLSPNLGHPFSPKPVHRFSPKVVH